MGAINDDLEEKIAEKQELLNKIVAQSVKDKLSQDEINEKVDVMKMNISNLIEYFPHQSIDVSKMEELMKKEKLELEEMNEYLNKSTSSADISEKSANYGDLYKVK